MAKDSNGSAAAVLAGGESPSRRDRHKRSKRDEPGGNGEGNDPGSSTDCEAGERRRNKRRRRTSRWRSHKRQESNSSDDSSPSSYSDSDSSNSESSSSLADSGSDSVRKRRREKRRRESERDRRRRKEKRRKEESERRRRKKEKEKRKRKKDKESKKRDKEKELGKTGPVTNSWGRYGIIREADMWNKRPEFQAWLAEVKQVNLETLPNWEEKQMFKQFMEDHNTATFPSKKYYDLDGYYHCQMEKEKKKGLIKGPEAERTVFDDEEQRRQELLIDRERHKEEQVAALKRSMQSGMAQAMKEQARLKEEMAYQYRLGNFEAAAAIQRRLDPDVAL